MERIFSIIFLLLLLQTNNNAAGQGYMAYHQQVAQAEEYIVQGKYDAAVSIYDSLFHSYDFCFPKDCYIAAQVASYINANEQCQFFLVKGLMNGLSANCLSVNPHLKKWNATSKKLDKATIDSLHAVYTMHINKKAQEDIHILFAADQNMIARQGSIYTKDNDLKPELQLFWDSLYNEIKQLTTTYGFPAEKVAGVLSDNNHKIAFQNTKAYFILIHHGMPDEDFKASLLREIDLGNISPQIYGGIMDIGRDFGSRTYCSIQTCNAEIQSGKCKKALSSRLSEINKNRTAIGLPTYECQEQEEILRSKYYKSLKDKSAANKPYFDFTFVHFQ